MNTLEQKLWNYIDGSCTADEQETIKALIASDEAARLMYHELSRLNAEFLSTELDEPPMAFTYKVMEAIRAGEAQKPLKAAISKRIIMTITIFFAVTILALTVYTFANINWSFVNAPFKMPFALKLPNTQNIFTKRVISGFLFFDVVLALFLFDGWLRRKKKLGTA